MWYSYKWEEMKESPTRNLPRTAITNERVSAVKDGNDHRKEQKHCSKTVSWR
jgi:hypothetical protein